MDQNNKSTTTIETTVENAKTMNDDRKILKIQTLHQLIQHYTNQFLSWHHFTTISRALPFVNHTNFKIIVFLSIAFYAYLKMTRVNPSNLRLWRMGDDIWFIFIGFVKLYYLSDYYRKSRGVGSQEYESDNAKVNNVTTSRGVKSDFWLIVRLLSMMMFNRSCGGNSDRTLQEDFFFSGSGNLFLGYFFV